MNTSAEFAMDHTPYFRVSDATGPVCEPDRHLTRGHARLPPAVVPAYGQWLKHFRPVAPEKYKDVAIILIVSINKRMQQWFPTCRSPDSYSLADAVPAWAA